MQSLTRIDGIHVITSFLDLKNLELMDLADRQELRLSVSILENRRSLLTLDNQVLALRRREVVICHDLLSLLIPHKPVHRYRVIP